jgi:hypothetical protein
MNNKAQEGLTMARNDLMLKNLALVVAVALLTASTGCGGSSSNDGDEIAQVFACMVFPLFCFYPINSSVAPGVLDYPAIDGKDQRIHLVTAISDTWGNTYHVGSIAGFPNATGAEGGTDAIVMKYDPTGNLLWARLFGSIDDERAEKLSVDIDEKVKVTIVKERNVEDGASHVLNEAFVLKLSDQGNILGLWAVGN